MDRQCLGREEVLVQRGGAKETRKRHTRNGYGGGGGPEITLCVYEVQEKREEVVTSEGYGNGSKGRKKSRP